MDAHGDLSAKRKRSTASNAAERPNKQLRPEGAILTPGDATPANGTVYNVEEDFDGAPSPAVAPAPADSPEWQATIEKVVKSAVSIHFCQTCSFDTELSMSSQATGFVVDAKRGYILTNRHVVGAGPFWGYCIFDNHEEVSSEGHGVCLICMFVC
jgi:S1-C subfamily serine protease